jgi:hypothetical protein
MGFRKSEPRNRLKFEITAKHCNSAVRKNPCKCVVAQALYARCGVNLAAIHVLPTTTTLVYLSGKISIYRTPRILRDGLKSFDETGEWDLAEGTYYLLPRKKSDQPGERAKRKLDPNRKHSNKGTRARAKNLDPRMITLRKMAENIPV